MRNCPFEGASSLVLNRVYLIGVTCFNYFTEFGENHMKQILFFLVQSVISYSIVIYYRLGKINYTLKLILIHIFLLNKIILKSLFMGKNNISLLYQRLLASVDENIELNTYLITSFVRFLQTVTIY